GAVLAMYSNPTYDDNNPRVGSTFDFALQAGVPPGSTFKVVTTSVVIDFGRFSPSSTINGNSPKTISGVPLQNDNNQRFGTIDLTTVHTYSAYIVFAQLGVQPGID